MGISVEAAGIAVHKFGGSSLATSARIHNVAKIIDVHASLRDFVVVSANGGVTDWLVALTEGNKQVLDQIDAFYTELAHETLADPDHFLSFFQKSLAALRSQSLSEAEILSFGEVWSANLLVAHLKARGLPAVVVDARAVLRTEAIDDFRAFDLSYFDDGLTRLAAEVSDELGDGEAIKIVTGFIASNPDGQTITLGRNGSDYTASLLARFSGAERVTLWTDVPGIYTADPRIVKTAQPIARLSYEEAMALAAVGTNVLHQKTINPLQSHHIPLYVRSSLKPHLPGTQVCRQGDERQPIKSLALKPDLVKVLLRRVAPGELANIQHHLFEANVPSLVSTCAETGEGPPASAVLVAAGSVDKACALLHAQGVDSEVLSDRRAVVAIVGQEVAASIDASSTNACSTKVSSSGGSSIDIDRAGVYSYHFMSLLSKRLPGVQHAVIDQGLEHALLIETCAAEAANVLAQVHALSFEEVTVQTQSVGAAASTQKA